VARPLHRRARGGSRCRAALVGAIEITGTTGRRSAVERDFMLQVRRPTSKGPVGVFAGSELLRTQQIIEMQPAVCHRRTEANAFGELDECVLLRQSWRRVLIKALFN